MEPKIGTAIQESVGVPCTVNETVFELLRGARMHLAALVKGLEGGAMEKAQLGLAHSYSRAKVKFNVNRSDNMIIQAICLLDQLDKDLNTFAMRIKDNYMYARVAQFIGRRSTLSEESLPKLTELTLDEDLSKAVLDAARSSMGMDCSEVDMISVDAFTNRVISLAEHRADIHTYLIEKMHNVAPNLSALIGEQVGARLISHA
ncbi:NOP56, partial [Symbiodinium sp. KB8]